MALNSYIKTLWKNLQAPAINETHLNNIEDGIFAVTSQAIRNSGDIISINKNIVSKTYDFAKVGIYDGGAIIIKSDTYQPIVSLAVQNREPGTYEITFSITFKYSVINKSALFRWSIDGGTIWKQISHEQKDSTNDELITYTFPKVLGAGDIDFKIEGKCESASNTLTVDFANIMLDRKI